MKCKRKMVKKTLEMQSFWVPLLPCGYFLHAVEEENTAALERYPSSQSGKLA